MIINIMVIAIALSIDALGIGLSYGIKGVKIPFVAKNIIGVVSAIIMLGSLYLGKVMLHFFPNEVTQLFGTVILVLIGISFIRNSLFQKDGSTYDFDQSKKIEWTEACILGFALSADSISAGVAVSALGLTSIWIPFLVGIMQVVLLCIGEVLVIKSTFLKEKVKEKTCGVFAGILLILMAVLRGIK